MSAEAAPEALDTWGMLTRGAAVGGAKGGVGTTMVSLLLGFGLGALRKDDRESLTVLVDTRGDLAIALGEEPRSGISDLSAGTPLEAALSELSVDPDPRIAGMPLLLHRGSDEPTVVEIDDAVGQITSRGWRPVIDCGSHDEAAELVGFLADRYLLSPLCALIPTTFAAQAAEAFAEPALAVVVDIGDGLLSAEEFAAAYEASALVRRIAALDHWQHDLSVPAELAAARDGSGDAEAAAAIATLTGLLHVQHY